MEVDAKSDPQTPGKKPDRDFLDAALFLLNPNWSILDVACSGPVISEKDLLTYSCFSHKKNRSSQS